MRKEDGGKEGGRCVCGARGGTNQKRCGEKKIKIKVTSKMMKRSRGKWMNGQRPDWTLVLNHLYF